MPRIYDVYDESNRYNFTRRCTNRVIHNWYLSFIMNLQTTVSLSTGNHMPILGLGTWQLTQDTAGTIEEALSLGYPMIDTSGDYGTQPGIAEGIKRSGIPREDIYIITKVEETDDAYEATKKNLAELDLSYVDLVLIHRPPKEGVGETLWEGLIRARQEGLAKDIGVSNYAADKIEKLIAATEEPPVVNQIEWSPFGHSDGMLDYAKENAIVIQAYSPLTRTERFDNATLLAIAKAHEKSPAQILIRWNLERGTVPIPKANQIPHVTENIDVFDFELTKADIDALSGLNERYSALGSLPYA